MSISEHVEEFAGLPVRGYDPGEGIVDPSGSAQRLAVEYDDDTTFADLLNQFLDDPAAGQVTTLVIGPWSYEWGDDGEEGSASIVGSLAAAVDRLPSLKALFFGDIIAEESEISWIKQCDITPLLRAYPALERLQVRGADGLGLDTIEHEGLRSLVIQSGGLPASVVRAVGGCNFPNLEHLELWLGTPDYGGDATPDDLAPILSGDRLPRLKYLGLCDSEIADQVAAALAHAPVVRRIETLDLSLGVLTDEGAVALIAGGNLSHLKKLDIHHHYVSDEALDGLKALGLELDDSDRQQPYRYKDGTEHRYVAVGE